jgi:protein-S-isoprenylcysteine O-methyltransferase Ste14
MNPLNTDNYPITSVTIGPASPVPLILTGTAACLAVLVVGVLTYLAVRSIRRRRLVKQIQQSQMRVLWGGP